MNFNWSGKIVGLLGLASKQDTNDIRNSAALGVAEFLLSKGVADIKVYDPVAGVNFMKYFADIDMKILLLINSLKFSELVRVRQRQINL